MKEAKGVSIKIQTTEDELLNRKKVRQLGGSHAVIIPKGWLDIFCKKTGEVYLVTMVIDTDTITIKPWREDEQSNNCKFHIIEEGEDEE